jgi:hypothetical protein
MVKKAVVAGLFVGLLCNILVAQNKDKEDPKAKGEILKVRKQLPDRLWEYMPEIIRDIALAPSYTERLNVLRRLLPLKKDEPRYDDLSAQEAYELIKLIEGENWAKDGSYQRGSVLYHLLTTRAKDSKWLPGFAAKLIRDHEEKAHLGLAILLASDPSESAKAIVTRIIKDLLDRCDDPGFAYQTAKLINKYGIKILLEDFETIVNEMGTGLPHSKKTETMLVSNVDARPEEISKLIVKSLEDAKTPGKEISLLRMLVKISPEKAAGYMKESMQDEDSILQAHFFDLVRQVLDQDTELVGCAIKLAKEGNISAASFVASLEPKRLPTADRKKIMEKLFELVRDLGELGAARRRDPRFSLHSLAQVLERLVTPDLVPGLKKLLKDEEDEPYQFAIAAFVAAKPELKIQDKEKQGIVKRLGEMLEDEDDYFLKVVIIRSLGRLGGDRAIMILKDVLSDTLEDWRERGRRIICEAAIEQLASLGTKDGIHQIVKALRDRQETVRRKALWALGKLKAKKTIKQIKKLLNHRSKLIQLHAAHTLARIKGKDARFTRYSYSTLAQLKSVKATIGEPVDERMLSSLIKRWKKRQLDQITHWIMVCQIFDLSDAKDQTKVKLLKELLKDGVTDPYSYHHIYDYMEKLEAGM